MVGDGITDAEAASVAGGADLFIGFGGVVRRPAVADAARWFVSSFSTLQKSLAMRKVAMVGSGAWACAAAKVVAGNLLLLPDFDDELTMWVHEEEVEFPPPPSMTSAAASWRNGSGSGGNGNGAAATKKGSPLRKLSDVINESNENVKYLPGVKLGKNVRAEPDLVASVRGADVLLICAPHQHASRIVRGLVGAVDPKGGPGGSPAVALSLIKGMRVRPEGPQLISAMIERVLGIETAVLMGANIAEEVARGGLTEATVAAASPATADLFVRLFSTDNFVVRSCADRVGVEMAGTLKNVVALAVGLATVRFFCDRVLGRCGGRSRRSRAGERERSFLRAVENPQNDSEKQKLTFSSFFPLSSFSLLLLLRPPPRQKQRSNFYNSLTSGPRRRRERQGGPLASRDGRDEGLRLLCRLHGGLGRRLGLLCPGGDVPGGRGAFFHCSSI